MAAAIGIGDDAFVIRDPAGVDFRHHQRHGRIDAEGRADCPPPPRRPSPRWAHTAWRCRCRPRTARCPRRRRHLSVSSSTVSSWPRKRCVLPAERPRPAASATSAACPRLSMQPTNSRPTAPVAPTIATCLVLHVTPFFCGSGFANAAIKKPRPGFGGAWSCRVSLVFKRARLPRPSRLGGLGLGRGLAWSIAFMGAGTYGADQALRQRL